MQAYVVRNLLSIYIYEYVCMYTNPCIRTHYIYFYIYLYLRAHIYRKHKYVEQIENQAYIHTSSHKRLQLQPNTKFHFVTFFSDNKKEAALIFYKIFTCLISHSRPQKVVSELLMHTSTETNLLITVKYSAYCSFVFEF